MIAPRFEQIDIRETLKESLSIEEKLRKLTSILLQLHANYEILKHFNSASEFEEFIVHGFRTANELLGIDSIMLFIHKGDHLHVMRSPLDQAADITPCNIPYDSSLSIWKVYKGGTPAIINNFEKNKKTFYGSYVKLTGIRSTLCLPLHDHKRAITGLMNIHSRARNAFNEISLPFYRELAGEVSKTMDRAKQYSHMKELSLVDELTGLYNRRFLHTILNKESKRANRYGSNFNLAICDFNGFKKINDTYGHMKGDEVLKNAAEIIRSRIRTSDYAVRYGGDEFAVVLLEATRENSRKIMDNINKSLMGHDFGIREKVSMSYGTSCYPEDTTDISELVAKADQALYRHKKNSR